VGNSILPDEDKVTTYADTFRIIASTVKYDSLYARTNYGYLGEFYDPLYGRLKSDYICQFYCEEDFRFEQTPDNGQVDTVSLIIQYYQWKGDGTSPMQMTVYPVDQPLTKNFYTNIDPTEFCDMQHPIASHPYSAQGGRLDSSVSSTSVTYYQEQICLLPIELGQKIYDETIHNPSSFSSQEAFNRFFPGIYITTDYGSGNLIYVSNTQIKINYHYTLESSTGTDSVIYMNEVFNVSKDVIQLNRFQNTNTDQLLEDNDDYTYLKTPAGIFTRLVIPAVEIGKIVENRIINDVSMSLKYMPEENWMYALTPPSYLLLVPEDSIGTFFENKNTENNITSYLSTSSTSTSVGYDESTRTYPFPNMANIINYQIRFNPDEDLRLLAIPVSRTSVSDSYGTYYTTSLSHYLAPSGLKVRKDGSNMKIVIISSYLNSRQ
jgi:hypothetical protein